MVHSGNTQASTGGKFGISTGKSISVSSGLVSIQTGNAETSDDVNIATGKASQFASGNIISKTGDSETGISGGIKLVANSAVKLV